MDIINARVIDVTVGELLGLIRGEVQKMLPKQEPPKPEEDNGPLYGLKGIAEALHVSKTKAMQLKRDGLLDGGFIQIDRTIIVRDPKALREIAERNTTKIRKKK